MKKYFLFAGILHSFRKHRFNYKRPLHIRFVFFNICRHIMHYEAILSTNKYEFETFRWI